MTFDNQNLEPSPADRAAIEDLVLAYAYAVDDQDWETWQRLFTADAAIDYREAGGISGTPAEVVAWMPGALSFFEWTLHSVCSHRIIFENPESASGESHIINRNEVMWEGQREWFEVGGVYEDTYRKVDGTWLFTSRVERVRYVSGNRFADLVRAAASSALGS